MSDGERPHRTVAGGPRLTPDEVAQRGFASSFRGLSESEVRAFLRRVADELALAREREGELQAAVDQLEDRLRSPRALDEQELLDALGEETARLLRSAREAADDIREKAEETSTRAVREAQERARSLREQAEQVLEERTREATERAEHLVTEAERRAAELREHAEREVAERRDRAEKDAEARVERARHEGRGLVDEAKEVRDRVLADLGRRRELLEAQIEALRNGRDHLLEAYRVVKRTFLEATGALSEVEKKVASGAPVAPPEEAESPAEEEAESPAGEGPAGEGGAADEGEGEGEPTPGGGEEPSEEAGADAEPARGDEIVGDATAPTLDEVDSLFARLRASRADGSDEPDDVASAPETVDLAAAEAAVEEAAAELAEEPAAGTPEGADATGPTAEPEGDQEGGEEPEGDQEEGDEGGVEVVDVRLVARDDAVDHLAGDLRRVVLRAAQDEQNVLLDAVRRVKRGRPVAADVMAAPEAWLAGWAEVVDAAVGEAYAAGVASVGDRVVAPPRDLATELADAFVTPLRERVVAAIDDALDGDDDATPRVTERIGARYREWKTEDLDAGLSTLLRAAYGRGVYDALPTDAVLEWVTPADGCSPDCSDNALEPTRRGEAFPTGHTHPPAHARCRCVVAVVREEQAVG